MQRVLHNIRLIDGRGGLWDRAAICIDARGLIEKVLIGEECSHLPRDWLVEDLEGATVLPGLIDCHVHLMFDSRARSADELIGKGSHYLTILGAANAERMLRSGVTTARDLAGIEFGDIAIRNAINQGLIPGPRLLVSGKCLTMTGGHAWHMGQEVDGVDEVRKYARINLKKGADTIKMMGSGGVMTPGVDPQTAALSPEELKAGFAEAQRAGKLSACHAQSSVGIKWAIDAGVRSIEHGFWLDDEACARMVERGVYLCPTLSAPYLILENSAGLPAEIVAKARRAYDEHRVSVDRARRAGVKIVCGTDAGTPFNDHGGVSLELELLAMRGGLSPMEAILSATQVAAESLKLDSLVGSVEPGKCADLLIVDGDPLKNLSILRSPRRVIKAGVDIEPVIYCPRIGTPAQATEPSASALGRLVAQGCGCL